ncbi:MAG: hypothetical protein FWD32_02295 [Firmicutes bacterium]|nr:hypothetical protein [Bacillota bacterium]
MSNPTTSLQLEVVFLQIDQKYRRGSTFRMEDAIKSITFDEIDAAKKTLQQIEQQAENALEDLANGVDKITEKYNKLKTKAEEDYYTRGLALSTIYVEQIAKLETECADKVFTFNERYLKRLSAKILELIEKDEKRVNAAIKQNNDFKLKAANYSVSLSKAYVNQDANALRRHLDIVKFEYQHGAYGLSKVINEEKYAAALDYLLELPASTAYFETGHYSFYAEHLTHGFYERLRSFLWNRLVGV